MKVLSLFDGMGGARLALQSLGIVPSHYYASEIDKFAIKVATSNFKDIEEVGDITALRGEDFKDIDLIIGGSPCQSFSIAGDGSGIDGKSKLFLDFVRMVKEVKPKYFLLENVASMRQKDKDFISAQLGVEPVEINSNLLTAQNRRRLYWANFPITQPEDKGIKLKDILSPVKECGAYELSSNEVSYMYKMVAGKAKRNHWSFGYHGDTSKDKSPCLLANLHKGVPFNVVIDWRKKDQFRKWTPNEVEKLQGVPEGYTRDVSKTQRYKMLGNGFTIPVIAHILKGMISYDSSRPVNAG
jgi:DNA (cytosine-5)-methyltransferase 3A